ncbi:MAG: hypothetical protein AB7Y46_19290 [Armatimonadota bacterium]
MEDKRLDVGRRYVMQARERGKDDAAIMEALRHAGWDPVELQALSRTLDPPLGGVARSGRGEVAAQMERTPDAAPEEGWTFPKAMRLIGVLLALGLLSYNVGACLLCALFHRPLMVWAGDGPPMVAVPGIDLGAEPVRPGSAMWWTVLLTYGFLFLLLGLRAARQVWTRQREDAKSARRMRQEARRAAASAPPLPAPPRPAPVAGVTGQAETKRIPLIDPKLMGLSRNGLLLLGIAGLLMLMAVVEPEAGAEWWSSALYCGIYGIGFGAVWLGFRHASATAVVFAAEELRLERGRRRLWAVAWAEVAGWYRELGGTGNLKAVAVRCRDGAIRRIDVGWIGLSPEHYATLFAEMEARSGLAEAPPAQVERDIQRLAEGLLYGLAAFLIIVAIILLIWG